MSGTAQPDTPERRRPWIRYSLAALAFCCLSWCCTLFVINPFNFMGQQSRSVAKWVSCRDNLHQISIALHDYHDVYGSFPPAYIADDEGRPMHSWRVLILPYLDLGDIYEQYRFDEPWNSEHNLSLVNKLPHDYNGDPRQPFHCPEADSSQRMQTNYVAVIGPETAWPGSDSRSFSDISDGASNTILIVEVADSGIHWMEPRDLTFKDMSFQIIDPLAGPPPDDRPRPSSHHIYEPPELYNPRSFMGVSVLTVDGRCERLIPGDAPDQIRALFTIAGDEDVSLLDR